MKKTPIGILDGGLEGINIFESLSRTYPNESFIYLTDNDNYPYEGKEQKDIEAIVKANVEKLLSLNVSAIIVVSASIVEYCEELLKDVKVPIVNIVEVIIDYVNTYFEQKNFVLVAKEYILKANLFQKNFKYNHLYNIPSDELETLIYEKKTKTARSFAKVREVFRSVINKSIDLLVYTDAFIENLSIEINEYCQIENTINLSKILMDSLIKKNIYLYPKRTGTKYIITTYTKKDIHDKAYWVNLKFKLIDNKNFLNITEKVNLEVNNNETVPKNNILSIKNTNSDNPNNNLNKTNGELNGQDRKTNGTN